MSFHHNPEFHRLVMQDKKLRVPKNYVEKYWKGISNPIFLRFPNGVEQKIFWKEKNGDIYFQKNWENFAKQLEYGNLLTFQHIGGPYFMVKIFGLNTVEINYSNIKSIEDKEKEVIEVSDDESEDESDDEFEDENEDESDDEFEDESDDESEDESDDEFEIVKKPQRTRNSKRKIHVDMASSSNRGGMAKKVKQCSVREIDENPFFEVKLTNCYATGHCMVLPSKFSRKHLNNFVGTALLQVGMNKPMEVNVKFAGSNRRSTICGGWKLFREKYNLQVEDSCKFVMIQRRPLWFIVIINRATKGPSPKKLHGWRKVAHNLWKNGK